MTPAEPRGVEQEEGWGHPECMCFDDDRCRYHLALDRASTLAAEVARQAQQLAIQGPLVEAAIAWRNAAPDGGRWYGHKLVATSGALMTAVDMYFAALGTKGAGDGEEG